MKKLMMVVLGSACAAGVAVAGNIDSPGDPSAGSGMYTLQNLYDYLTSGAALTVPGSFQDPTAGPSSTMKTTKQIGDDAKALFDQCDAAVDDISSGKKFFCTGSGSWGVKTGTLAQSQYYTVLKTGQTSVYQTGDDGSYASSKGKAFSYSWGGGTDVAQDNVTGLMWASLGSGAGCNSSGALNWTSAIDWAEALSFAGYTDWRLPNVTEMQTLLVRNIGQGSPFINKTYFPGAVASGTTGYWSSTTCPNSITAAFFTLLGGAGSTSVQNKTIAHYVRAVRGGE